MIPKFPVFKKLEFTDKQTIDGYVHTLPVYSDFDFASMWAWNVKDDMEVSDLNKNLVIRFTDYLTGEAFYTFIGTNAVNHTATAIIEYSEKTACGSSLHLIPHEVVLELDPLTFDATEARDHFDYVLSLERYLTYSGGKLKSRRNFLNNFKKNHPDYTVEQLDLDNEETKQVVTNLYNKWKTQKGFMSLSESFAYDRFLEVAKHFEYMALGLKIDGMLIAFHVSALPPGNHANGLFEKADVEYTGVYQALMHEVAKALIARGKHFLNYEQDLGLESLRKSKMAFDPIHFQKKYTLSKKK